MNKHDYLNTLGIDIFEPCQKNTAQNTSWDELKTIISHCTRCPLSASRKQTVFGDGDCHAKLMIIGEAPGADEDAQGQPFVGRAGKLLTEMLKSIGLAREHIFITNILKCRPPQNRDPQPTEVSCCTPYLQQQIDFIKPTLIVALGKIAGQFLLNTESSLANMRGKIHQYGKNKTPLLITYHPAYLLRAPLQKAKSYEDFRDIQALLHQK